MDSTGGFSLKKDFSMLSMSVAFIILHTLSFFCVFLSNFFHISQLNILLHPEYSFWHIWQANKALLMFLTWTIKNKMIRKAFNLYC